MGKKNIYVVKYEEEKYGLLTNDTLITSVTYDGMSYIPVPKCSNGYSVQYKLTDDSYKDELVGTFTRCTMHNIDIAGLIISVNRDNDTCKVVEYISPINGRIICDVIPLSKIHV